MRPAGFTSVMAARRSPPRALDYFPTAPWATRAGAELISELDPCVERGLSNATDPACGGGHMAFVLEETFGDVVASDIFNYGWGHDLADFLSDDWSTPYPDWIITNPPFSAGLRFAELALQRARRGVALLCRSAFSEGAERYRRLFGRHCPAVEAQFCERVPMVAGRWDPEASSATAYSWFIWLTDEDLRRPACEKRWIAPGTRKRLWHADDIRRFAPEAPAPLLDRVAP